MVHGTGTGAQGAGLGFFLPKPADREAVFQPNAKRFANVFNETQLKTFVSDSLADQPRTRSATSSRCPTSAVSLINSSFSDGVSSGKAGTNIDMMGMIFL